jgi:hypothetical protein
MHATANTVARFTSRDTANVHAPDPPAGLLPSGRRIRLPRTSTCPCRGSGRPATRLRTCRRWQAPFCPRPPWSSGGRAWKGAASGDAGGAGAGQDGWARSGSSGASANPSQSARVWDVQGRMRCARLHRLPLTNSPSYFRPSFQSMRPCGTADTRCVSGQSVVEETARGLADRTRVAPQNLAMPLPVSQLAHVLGPPDRATHCEGYCVTDLPKGLRCPGALPKSARCPNSTRTVPAALSLSQHPRPSLSPSVLSSLEAGNLTIFTSKLT